MVRVRVLVGDRSEGRVQERRSHSRSPQLLEIFSFLVRAALAQVQTTGPEQEVAAVAVPGPGAAVLSPSGASDLH